MPKQTTMPVQRMEGQSTMSSTGPQHFAAINRADAVEPAAPDNDAVQMTLPGVAAPSPVEFQSYIEDVIYKSANDLLRLMLDGNNTAPIQLTTAVSMGVIDVADEVKKTIEERGKKYGEDVLFILGEPGFVVMAMSKMLRLFWSFQQGLEPAERRDSWIDLVGYGVLCLAYEQYNATLVKK